MFFYLHFKFCLFKEDLELITEIALIAEKKVSEFKIEHQE